MNFEIIPLNSFLEQVERLSDKDKAKVKEKILLIEQNPFRYKALKSKYRIFRVRMNLSGSESRLSYAVVGNNIYLMYIGDRKDYEWLPKIIAELEKVI